LIALTQVAFGEWAFDKKFNWVLLILSHMPCYLQVSCMSLLTVFIINNVWRMWWLV